MGFSYMRSKLPMINSYGVLCLNKGLYQQRPLKNFMINSLVLSFRSPFNLGNHSNKFRMLSSIACLYGLQKVNSGLFRSIGANIIRVPYHQLPAKIVRIAATSNTWRWLRYRKYRLIDFSIILTILFCSLQWIPCSNKIQIVINSDKIERFLGGFAWEKMEKENAGKILPPTSPESIRVQAILRDIVQALHQWSRLQHDCSVSVYAPTTKTTENCDGFSQRSLVVSNQHHLEKGSEIVIDSEKKIQRVVPKEKRARKFGIKYGTKHLEGLNWQVIVVDRYYVENAAHIPSGKIVFYTGYLRCTDAEIAAILGHEVAHGVARHVSENLLTILWILPFVWPFFRDLNDSRGLVYILGIVMNFLSRRKELEADYIGLMLMAAAGYDPREAPPFYLRLGDSEGSIKSTHPSGPRRAKKLNQVKVMKKAVHIYEQVKAGQKLESFM